MTRLSLKLLTVEAPNCDKQTPRRCISSLAKAERGGASSKAAFRQTSDNILHLVCAFIKVALTVVSASR